MKVDDIDWNILACLQDNARMSNAEIGRRIGISPPAVADRIRKMEDVGIIQAYKPIISPIETGLQLRAIITIRAFMGKLRPFLEKVKTFEEVLNCYRITGNENIVMEVVFKDQKHMESFIDQIIIYGESKTQIVLSHVVNHAPIKQKLLK